MQTSETEIHKSLLSYHWPQHIMSESYIIAQKPFLHKTDKINNPPAFNVYLITATR